MTGTRARSLARLLSCTVVVAALASCGSDDGSALRSLAESYAGSSAQQVKEQLDTLTVHDHFVLEYVGKQFKAGVFAKACEADGAIRWTYLADGSAYDCTKAAADWQGCVAQVGEPGCLANIETGRLAVINYYACKSGEIDEATCALYNQITNQIDQGTAQTSQTIVDNIGNKCTVGQDPGCYP